MTYSFSVPETEVQQARGAVERAEVSGDLEESAKGKAAAIDAAQHFAVGRDDYCSISVSGHQDSLNVTILSVVPEGYAEPAPALDDNAVVITGEQPLSAVPPSAGLVRLEEGASVVAADGTVLAEGPGNFRTLDGAIVEHDVEPTPQAVEEGASSPEPDPPLNINIEPTPEGGQVVIADASTVETPEGEVVFEGPGTLALTGEPVNLVAADGSVVAEGITTVTPVESPADESPSPANPDEVAALEPEGDPETGVEGDVPADEPQADAPPASGSE